MPEHFEHSKCSEKSVISEAVEVSKAVTSLLFFGGQNTIKSFCPSKPALVGPSPFKCIYSLLVKGNSKGTARYYWAGCSLCKQHLLNICNIPETVLSSFSMINFVQSSHLTLGESCSPHCIKARALGSFMIAENSAPFTALLGVV